MTPDWPTLISGPARTSGLLTLGATPQDIAARATGYVYLATPYSLEVVGEDGKWSRHRSYLLADLAVMSARRLAGHGVTAVSPIVLTDRMCSMTKALDPLDDDYWTRWCAPILRGASAVVVPEIEGWQRSRGIWHEVTWALERAVPVWVGAEGAA